MEYVYIYEHFNIMDYISDERVKSAVYAVNGDSIVVALLLEPIYFRSEREALIADIKSRLSEGFNEVIISSDTEVYYRTLNGKTDFNELKTLAVRRG